MVWWVAVVLGAVVLLLWWWNGAGSGSERLALAVFSSVLWLLCAVVSWRALQAQVEGVISWDGVTWIWLCHGQTYRLLEGPQVVMDLQALMVLRCKAEGHGWQHWVVQRDWAPHAWIDLRRAVYSSVHPTGVARKEL